MPCIKGTDRNQVILFSESIDDYTTSDNPVRVIVAYVEQVDMVAHNFSFAVYPSSSRPTCDPKVMINIRDVEKMIRRLEERRKPVLA